MAKRTCSVDGCERPSQARGWCRMHYKRWQRRADVTDLIARPKGTCSVEGCEKVARRRVWCNMHYERWRVHGDVTRGRPSFEQRFWAQVDRRTNADCWFWTGQIMHGYGYIKSKNRRARAHRVAYELTNGPIPQGLDIDHLCHNRAVPPCPGGFTCVHRCCVNPDHLEAVTHRENVLRGQGPTAMQARKTHCKRGHPFDEANTIRTEGRRRCRTCYRQRRASRRRGSARRPTPAGA